jgi:predicted DNA-binding transcriptional regulator AlpA
MSIPEESTVLSSWKDIAQYLGKGVRTVQRWERQFGLPVRRPIGAPQKSAVLLYRRDVDEWLAKRFSARPPQNNKTALPNSCLTGSALNERIHKSQELRATHFALSEKILESLRLLTENCNSLTSQTVREPWLPAPPAVPKLSPDSLPGLAAKLSIHRIPKTSVR